MIKYGQAEYVLHIIVHFLERNTDLTESEKKQLEISMKAQVLSEYRSSYDQEVST